MIDALGSSWLGARAAPADLAIIGRSKDSHLSRKTLAMAVALFGPPMLWGYGRLLDVDFSAIVLWSASAAFAIILFAAPDITLKAGAADRRRQFRQTLISYLDLVALCRAAGRGPADALESAARIGRGWTFRRLARALDPIHRGTTSAWDELTRLAEEINVPELAEVAAIARLAATEGAGILDTLRAKAANMRENELAALLAKAKSRTETMTVPMSLSVLGFMILLGYPAFTRMTGGA
jgi:pilus assembly protein TadC